VCRVWRCATPGTNSRANQPFQSESHAAVSGIAGFIHFDGAPAEPKLVEKMTAAMAHRGPDGIHHWVKGSVALGQCMLCTTPESLEETQPLTNEDESLVLVMDGRVDNWEELRRELLGRGAVLRTRADAELVLRAYEVWCRDCLLHIDGDFALVIWDAQRNEAFCARDRVGNRPFNYHWDGKTLVFASELHSIMALPWVNETLNEGMLAEFLAVEWYSRDETFWQGILRLVAAHRMIVDARGPRIDQYWRPDPWRTLPYSRDEDYIEHYRELLADTVRRLSRSHRPVAYEVSGGLDSSAVYCMAEHLRLAGRLPAPAIEGYTLAFPDDEAANELEYSRAVGDHLGQPIHEIPPSLVPLSWYRERAGQEREFPGYPNGAMSLGLRQQAQTSGARAILSGLGGDEWLGDFWSTRAYYVEEFAAGRWRTWYNWLKADARDYGADKMLWWLLRNGIVSQLPPTMQTPLRQVWRLLRTEQETPFEWLTDDLQQLLTQRRSAHRPVLCPLRHPGQAAQLLSLDDSYTAWAIETEERMAARIGMELRHPLRAPALVEFSFAMPARLLVRGRLNKYLHVRAIQGLLPEKITTRTSKAEFSVVSRSQLANIAEDMAIIAARRKHWFRSHQPANLYAAYQSGNLAANIGTGMAQWLLSGAIGCDVLVKSDQEQP
jgi:asparagine synthase (glutamine-hydrolysing)